ncbi:hypothetical protein AIOL_001983 [Candidatus Rhodobacter oscarellae]|uniref:DUF4169 domain-containing protein n=1 Tax=Candidatus Rhodobacter oscarellae TaxID=1675527 RepID=A0A0J9E2R1_9RHOB|nr:DUF4169 family protein [Candidatus Rhodobacter lobularis]KMW57025.1 hypothetical protein AIOL_001983 [Candidatus Rhodobacter lobularis]
MNQPINLNKARKSKARSEAKAQADQNAASFGMTKAARLLAATQTDRAKASLDRHKMDPDNDLDET